MALYPVCKRCGCTKWRDTLAPCNCGDRPIATRCPAPFKEHDKVKYLGENPVLKKKKHLIVSTTRQYCIFLYGRAPEFLNCWPKEDFEVIESRHATLERKRKDSQALRHLRRAENVLKYNLNIAWNSWKSEVSYALKLMDPTKKLPFMAGLPPKKKALLLAALEGAPNDLLERLLRTALADGTFERCKTLEKPSPEGPGKKQS